MTRFRGDAVGIAAIVFDLDGTLYVNRDLGRAIHDTACRHVGRVLQIAPEDADRRIQEEKAQLFRETGFSAPLSRACERLGVDIRDLHASFTAEVVPEPFLRKDERVAQLLRDLAEKFTLVLYTNNNRALSGRIVRTLGIEETFSRTYTIEASWDPKPSLPFLTSIFADIGLSPAECLFVGDRYDVDLRLPESLGAQIFLSSTLEDLLSLRVLLEGQPAEPPA